MEEEGEVEGSLETAWLFLMSALQMQDKGNRNGIRGMRCSVFVYILMSIIWTFVSAVSSLIDPLVCLTCHPAVLFWGPRHHFTAFPYKLLLRYNDAKENISSCCSSYSAALCQPWVFHTLSMSGYAVCRIWTFILAWQSNLFMKVRVDVCWDSMPLPRLCALLFLPHVSFYQPLDK